MKKTMIMALLALAFIAITPQAKADSWTTKFLVDQGFSQLNNPMGGTQDTAGNKWFQVYRNNGPDGEGDWIYELKTDGTWVNHSDEIVNIENSDPGGWGQTNFTNPDTRSLYADTVGNIWVVTPNGLLLKYRDGAWTTITPESVWSQILGYSVSGATGSFGQVFGDNQGNIYTAAGLDYNGEHDDRVLKLTPGGSWSVAIPKGGIINENNRNTKLLGAYNNTNGDIWFCLRYGDESGIYRYTNGQWVNYTTANGLADNVVNNIIIDSAGNVYAHRCYFNQGRVSIFNGTVWSALNSSNSGLAEGLVSQIVNDPSGKVWFSIYGGGVNDGTQSIFDPSNNTWSYYSAKNGMDEMTGIQRVFFLGNEFWAWSGGANGFLIIERNNTQTGIYGQTSGDLVTKTGFDPLKKKKTKTINSKAVTIYKITKVKKKKKYKTKKTLVYRTGATQWYKVLNLDTGKYQVVSKAKGKKKKTRTINITSGEPYRLDLRY